MRDRSLFVRGRAWDALLQGRFAPCRPRNADGLREGGRRVSR